MFLRCCGEWLNSSHYFKGIHLAEIWEKTLQTISREKSATYGNFFCLGLQFSHATGPITFDNEVQHLVFIN